MSTAIFVVCALTIFALCWTRCDAVNAPIAHGIPGFNNEFIHSNGIMLRFHPSQTEELMPTVQDVMLLPQDIMFVPENSVHAIKKEGGVSNRDDDSKMDEYVFNSEADYRRSKDDYIGKNEEEAEEEAENDAMTDVGEDNEDSKPLFFHGSSEHVSRKDKLVSNSGSNSSEDIESSETIAEEVAERAKRSDADAGGMFLHENSEDDHTGNDESAAEKQAENDAMTDAEEDGEDDEEGDDVQNRLFFHENSEHAIKKDGVVSDSGRSDQFNTYNSERSVDEEAEHAVSNDKNSGDDHGSAKQKAKEETERGEEKHKVQERMFVHENSEHTTRSNQSSSDQASSNQSSSNQSSSNQSSSIQSPSNQSTSNQSRSNQSSSYRSSNCINSESCAEQAAEQIATREASGNDNGDGFDYDYDDDEGYSYDDDDNDGEAEQKEDDGEDGEDGKDGDD